MTIGTPAITQPGDAGLLLLKSRRLAADNSAELAKSFGFPSISVDVTTTTNDSGEVLNLSDYFDFPSGMMIPVTLRHYARTDNDRYFQELEYLVIGSETAGTDPVIVGDGAMTTGVQGKIKRAFGVLAGAAQAYGRVHAKSVVDTEATDGLNSHGVAMAAFSTGNSALTFPLSRAVKVIGTNVSGSDATLANNRSIRVQAPAAAGTAAILTASEGATDALADPAATSIVEAELELYPPVNAFLVMDGTPDPGEVLVYVLGISSDQVRHRVDVFIGEPIDGSFFGSA